MQQLCIKKLDEIAAVLLDSSKNQEIGLYSGNTGLALFLFYYARFKNSATLHQQASKILDDLFIQIESASHPLFSFCSGIAGVSWLVDHLCRQGFLQANSDEMISDVDIFLYESALFELSHGHFDFLHGAMGVVFYFAKRNRQDYLRHLVRALDNTAVWDGDCAKWRSILNHEERLTGYNISLSHGSSSIALVLCKVLQIMPKDETAEKLLRGAIKYICNQEIPLSQYGCFFPSFSIESQPDLFKTRLAWCYGDLGIAFAIWKTGLLFHHQAWIDKGMEVLLHAANRRGLAENKVMDAGICHGAAGVAHIFHRLYRDSGRKEFKDAADYWCIETLKMAAFEDGLAGYKTWRSEQYGGWQPNDNLLEGITGIGMCLLSFVMPDFSINQFLEWMAELDKSPDYLKEILTRSDIQEAIFLASPVLFDETSKYLNDRLKPKDREKFFYSALKYLSRMATRCTPFGLFAGCSVGQIAENNDICPFYPEQYSRHTRLDMNYLCALAQEIAKDSELRHRLLPQWHSEAQYCCHTLLRLPAAPP